MPIRANFLTQICVPVLRHMAQYSDKVGPVFRHLIGNFALKKTNSQCVINYYEQKYNIQTNFL